MYIRRIARRTPDGSQVGYLQLAHKVRDPKSGAPRDEILYHFGREDTLDKDQIKRLALSLARFLDPAGQAEVQLRLEGQAGPEVEAERSLSYGGAYVLDALWRRLEIDRTLQELLAKRSFGTDVERAIFAMVANRALDPDSKLAVERWAGQRVALPGLDGVEVHNLYRAMDFLEKHDGEVQRAVYFSVATLLNLDVDLLFFDTTSTYFETEDADGDEGLRRFGKSKDHREDRPQVVIGLAVTRGGIPVRYWVLPGNTNDASLVEQVQRDLAGWRLNRVVWVMDRGMCGEPQRLALQRGGGQVIVGEKLRHGSAEAQAALTRAGRYQQVQDNLEVKEIEVESGSEKRRFVLVRNPEQVVRDKAQREQHLARLAEKLERLNAQRSSDEAGHSKEVCRLKVHPTYARYLKALKGGRLEIDQAVVKAEEKLDGKYLLSTTDRSLSAADVALGYKQLIDVERAFGTLKSTLDLRPVYHRRPDRIRAHVLLCWLALLLVRVAETGARSTWPRMRDTLETLCLVRLSTKDGVLDVATRLTPEQRQILQPLEIKEPPRITRIAPGRP
jgi:hypothetical protein